METHKQMSSALDTESWDIIISDHNMPMFSGPEALKLLMDSGLDIPLISVSGAIGEGDGGGIDEGRQGFILKNNLVKLAATITRELKEAGGHRKGA